MCKRLTAPSWASPDRNMALITTWWILFSLKASCNVEDAFKFIWSETKSFYFLLHVWQLVFCSTPLSVCYSAINMFFTLTTLSLSSSTFICDWGKDAGGWWGDWKWMDEVMRVRCFRLKMRGMTVSNLTLQFWKQFWKGRNFVHNVQFQIYLCFGYLSLQ